MGKLLEINEQYRKQNLSRKIYHSGDEYGPGHTRAISDEETPEWGKGRDGDRVGSATDIQRRTLLKTKNNYNFNNQYGVNKD